MTGPLDRLPPIAERRLAVRINNDALRQVRGGHPWVYADAITSVSHDGNPGDLAAIFDAQRTFAAIGMWDPDSPIAIKVLHAGKPRTIDNDFWVERIRTAVELRRPLLEDPDVTGLRLIHGENDRLPGLVLDRYDTTAVIKLYSPAWYPHLPAVLAAIDRVIPADHVVIRLARLLTDAERVGLHDGLVLENPVLDSPAPDGSRPDGPELHEPVVFREHGLSMTAHPVSGQKTGYFLDQRDNRATLATLSEHARVLDVFSCTGGFSVHAAAGGARAVTSVDIAPAATATATENMRRNHDRPAVAACDHATITGDAFDVMASLRTRGERYDIVVIDPPSFASRAADVDRAVRAYRRLTHLGLDLINPGGLLVQASCSSRVSADDFVPDRHAVAAQRGVELHEVHRSTHALDHPIGFPQGGYLKALFARVG